MIEILMPALSPTMRQANIVQWYKQVGDDVHSGEVLAELETDKATMEFESAHNGVFAEILIPDGTQRVKVNTPICRLASTREEFESIRKS